MKKLRPAVVITAASLVGAVSVCAFLTLNDPDTVAKEAVHRFGWFVLAPLAFVFALCPRPTPWFAALGLIAGVFVGASIRALIGQSNIWPIAGVFWTVLFVPSVVVGMLAGVVGSWCLRKCVKKSEHRP